MSDRPDTPNESLLREIIERTVQHPDKVMIDSWQASDGTVTLEIDVADADYPLVVGRGGSRIKALEYLWKYMGAREQKVYRVMLVPKPERIRVPYPPLKMDPNWKSEATVMLLYRVLGRILEWPFKVETRDIDMTSTLIDVQPCENERELVDGLLPTLRTIFHAIGMNEGRVLEFQRMLAPEPEAA